MIVRDSFRQATLRQFEQLPPHLAAEFQEYLQAAGSKTSSDYEPEARLGEHFLKDAARAVNEDMRLAIDVDGGVDGAAPLTHAALEVCQTQIDCGALHQALTRAMLALHSAPPDACVRLKTSPCHDAWGRGRLGSPPPPL